MDVEEFQWPTRLLSRRISPKPSLVERGAPCSVRDPVGDRRESFWRRRLRLGHAADASPANAHDGQMRAGVRTRSSASEESRTLRAGIRTSNDCAHSPEWSRDPSVDKTQVRSISSSCTIVPHRWAEWRSIYPAARSNLGASIA